MIREQDFLFKLVIVGNQGVGKSSLFIRFCDDNFVDNYLPTIGVDFRFKKIERLTVRGLKESIHRNLFPISLIMKNGMRNMVKKLLISVLRISEVCLWQ
jgi:GTPase SAR1 family protein